MLSMVGRWRQEGVENGDEQDFQDLTVSSASIKRHEPATMLKCVNV
jgi:hypothetical protein